MYSEKHAKLSSVENRCKADGEYLTTGEVLYMEKYNLERKYFFDDK